MVDLDISDQDLDKFFLDMVAALHIALRIFVLVILGFIWPKIYLKADFLHVF